MANKNAGPPQDGEEGGGFGSPSRGGHLNGIVRIRTDALDKLLRLAELMTKTLGDIGDVRVDAEPSVVIELKRGVDPERVKERLEDAA